MNVTDFMIEALKEQEYIVSLIQEDQISDMADAINSAKRLFVAGSGRSGNIVKMFCMRCMHMGMKAYVVGETVTPGITEGDILLIGSGSGETQSLIGMAKKAKQHGASVGLVTIHRDSSIGNLADHVIVVPGTTKKSQKGNTVNSVQPSGNLFEQTMLLMLDSLVVLLADKKQFDVDDLFLLHANLE